MRYILVISLLLGTDVIVGWAEPDWLTRGTLNLVLANKNGVVMASDSRASFPGCRQYSDDSQKLFRTGPYSALAIAGFASFAAHIPYAMHVADVIRSHYDPKWNTAPGAASVFTDDWLELQVLPDIRGLAAIVDATYALPPPTKPAAPLDFSFIATIVDIRSNAPRIKQMRFVPKTIKFGPLGNAYYDYTVQTDEFLVKDFNFETAGIADFVLPFLRGTKSSSYPEVKKYQVALRNRTRDRLSLQEMEDLARRLLAITAANTPCVGGPDQVAVIPLKGAATWNLLTTKGATHHLPGSQLAIGLIVDGVTARGGRYCVHLPGRPPRPRLELRLRR